ncbi:MAG TPA: prephenate dehydratase domain-containing protein [Pyrinomonadaceae bacterium]|nr:prephenate dehydratase domain-containing protein [Pyrinomonadaceae bacterium]
MSSTAYKPRVAFQGERGAFSEEAALKLLGPDIELVPQCTFETLFRSVENGEADYVLAPVANSIAGPVHASLDLLRRSSLLALDEVEIQIEQHLIGCPDATLTNIETVQSHPVALAQCKRFFAEHPRLKPIGADDTAGSVAEVIRRGDATRAAIAGRRAAQLYGASIVRESIQDTSENFTRFVLLGMKGKES